MAEALAFYTLAALILGCAVLVIVARNPVHSVLFLVASLLLVAVLYVLLRAEFVAVIQVLVYAGGIVVLYLFVVMLVNLKRAPEQHAGRHRRTGLGVALAGVVLAQIAALVIFAGLPDLPAPARPAEPPAAGNVEQIGLMLYTDYLIPFEVAGILLLVAMIGAITLARRDA